MQRTKQTGMCDKWNFLTMLLSFPAAELSAHQSLSICCLCEWGQIHFNGQQWQELCCTPGLPRLPFLLILLFCLFWRKSRQCTPGGCDAGMALRKAAQGCSQGLLQDLVPRMALTTYIHYHGVWKHGSKQVVSANSWAHSGFRINPPIPGTLLWCTPNSLIFKPATRSVTGLKTMLYEQMDVFY